MTRPAMQRRQQPANGGSYFGQRSTEVEFFSTGCTTLDLALGGGWARRRISNIVGDRSTGKTLLAIEAAANFARSLNYKCRIRYRERERAFQEDYAKALGLPMEVVDFGTPDVKMETVEDFAMEMQWRAKNATVPELVIMDSLDAFSSEAEMKRGFADTNTFKAEKAKLMSEFFRKVNASMSDADITVMYISQIRDNMNAKSWRGWTRAGGKALDFYATHVLYLAQLGTVKRQVQGIERVTGITIKAKVDKNKVAAPYREAVFNILFNYGTDDVSSCIEWLKNNGGLGDALSGMKETAFVNTVRHQIGDWKRLLDILHRAVEEQHWRIERSFLMPKPKYARSEADAG